MPRVWLHISFFWLAIVAILGLILRSFPLFDFNLNYKNILHAHSHAAFLGWVFSALFCLICTSFLPAHLSKKIKTQFVLIQIANVGMLIFFLYQGYAAFSIFFSALHMAVSFWFAISVFNTLKLKYKLPSVKFLFAGLIFMMLSAIGPLSLPIIAKVSGSGSSLYMNAIYFYLHFQYNGWFLFTLLALLIKVIEEKGVGKIRKEADSLFVLLSIGTLFACCLSFLWANSSANLRMVGIAGAVIQIFALIPLFKIMGKLFPLLNTSTERLMGVFVISAFSVKVMLQLVSAIPYFSDFIYGTRGLIVAYLHLVLLGIVTPTLFILFIRNKFLDPLNESVRFGLQLFAGGFVATEVFTVSQAFLNLSGRSLPAYHLFLFLLTVIILISLFFIYNGRKREYKKTNNKLILKTN